MRVDKMSYWYIIIMVLLAVPFYWAENQRCLPHNEFEKAMEQDRVYCETLFVCPKECVYFGIKQHFVSFGFVGFGFLTFLAELYDKKFPKVQQ